MGAERRTPPRRRTRRADWTAAHYHRADSAGIGFDRTQRGSGAVAEDLAVQEREARWWRDASLLYFQTFSRMPLPDGYERPVHSLDYVPSLRCPANPRRPRCDGI